MTKEKILEEIMRIKHHAGYDDSTLDKLTIDELKGFATTEALIVKLQKELEFDIASSVKGKGNRVKVLQRILKNAQKTLDKSTYFIV